MRLSAVVITRNEETNIERCLKSVSFCDEIIVVDSESTDQTREIAARYATKVIVHSWKGYAAQKNFAVEASSGEWVLSLDADEEVSAELREEILSILQRAPEHQAYSVPRKTMQFGKWIRYGGWYPNRLVRLFKKGTGRWEGEEVHEFWKTTGTAGQLAGHLFHYSFKNLSDQVERNNKYSSLGALRLRKSGRAFSLTGLTFKSVSKFMETYFLKLGFLDGYPGFIISVSAAYSVFLKWAKLWEFERSGSRP